MASDDALLDQVKFSNPLATTSMDDEGDVSPPRHQSRPTLGPMPENALMNLSLDVMQGMKSLDPQAKALMGTDEARERRDLDALNYMDANKIISPDSEFRHHWDLVQVPLLIYVAIAIPYRIGFSHDTNPWYAPHIGPTARAHTRKPLHRTSTMEILSDAPLSSDSSMRCTGSLGSWWTSSWTCSSSSTSS